MKKTNHHTISLQNQPEYTSFLKSALAIQGSITPKVMKKVLIIIIYTSLISYFCFLFPSAILPIGPFEYGGLIMGLILVFRVNSGYDRWWEARKIWGNVVNQSRNLAIIVVQYTNKDAQAWVLKVTQMMTALAYLMKDNLREHTELQYLNHLVDNENFSKITQANNRPVIIANMIAKELKIARNEHGLDNFSFLHAQEQLEQLVDAQGACERIIKTPIPFVMAVKSRSFILFFLLMLPYALANVSLLISPVIAGFVSYALFSLDQIGIELQNPFSQKNLSHLPLDSICKSIEENIQEIRQC
jgi:putative membrane protein